MKLTIARKMYLGFSAVLILLLIMGGFSYLQLVSVNQTYENLLDDRVQKMNIVRDMISLSKDIQLANRGYLLIGNEESLSNYQQSRTRYDELSNELEAKLNTDTGKKLLQELEYYSDRYVEVAEKTISLKQNNDPRYVDVISKEGPPPCDWIPR